MPGSVRSPSKVLRRLKLTPLASRGVENWSSFMYHYALGLTPGAPYRFRNGARLRINRAIDHVPIIEIFLHKDYGEIPDGSVIVDLGASIGAFTVYAATMARHATVYACEPLPAFFELLQANVTLNKFEDRVRCFNVAVAADGTDRELIVGGDGLFFPTLVAPPQANRTSIRVPCTDLSALLDANALSHVDILKMDVEGSEYDVLYGTPSNVLRRIREIRLEYHNLDDGRRNVTRLKQFLEAGQYSITREQAGTATNGTLWARHHD
jgi:FkbM family methyltransferase